jgi:uncharacterized damage-inducible protein DinB
MSNPASATPAFLTPEAALAHWQGHRRLSRRTIVAFPDDQLFTFSVGGMRPFGELALEMIGMVVPTVKGMATGEWSEFISSSAKTKEELLRVWDATTAELDAWWPKLPAERFHESMNAFGQWTMIGHELLLYAIDNEIHHRGQGTVYLRALGIQPPAFYDRS